MIRRWLGRSGSARSIDRYEALARRIDGDAARFVEIVARRVVRRLRKAAQAMFAAFRIERPVGRRGSRSGDVTAAKTSLAATGEEAKAPLAGIDFHDAVIRLISDVERIAETARPTGLPSPRPYRARSPLSGLVTRLTPPGRRHPASRTSSTTFRPLSTTNPGACAKDSNPLASET